MPQGAPPEKPRFSHLLVFSLLLTIPWLCFSAKFALLSGDDCDIWRQWKVSQYVHRGVNPYQVAVDILMLNFGSMHGPDRLRLGDFKLYEVHPNLHTEGVTNYLAEVGPPTATYPPSSLLPIAYTAGLLPANAVHIVWLTVCLATLILLVRQFSGLFPRGTLFWLSVILAWPPTHEAIRTLQFTLLVLCWTLAAIKYVETKPLVSGLFFGLALVKPSVSLPFLVIPLAQGRWTVLLVAAAMHVVGLQAMSWLVHAPPWAMLAQWMEIPRYMLQGAYGLQEITNRLGFDNSTVGTVIMLGFAALCAAWTWWNRRANTWDLLAFLCFASVLWTYHERYDFVVLLIPLAVAIQRGARLPILIAFALLGVALSDPAYTHDHPAAWCLRWAGRLALGVLFCKFALDLRRSNGQVAAPP